MAHLNLVVSQSHVLNQWTPLLSSPRVNPPPVACGIQDPSKAAIEVFRESFGHITNKKTNATQTGMAETNRQRMVEILKNVLQEDDTVTLILCMFLWVAFSDKSTDHFQRLSSLEHFSVFQLTVLVLWTSSCFVHSDRSVLNATWQVPNNKETVSN